MSSPGRAMEPPLPSNIDAERSILGAILLDNSAITAALKQISSGDFFHVHHQKIFRRMLQMQEAGEPIDLVTLCDRLGSSKEIDDVGGAPYIASLMDGVPRGANTEQYAKIVREKARLRSLIHLSQNIQKLAQAPEADLESIRSKLQGGIENSNGHVSQKTLVAMELADFLAMTLDPVEFIVEPILPVGNSAMIFSPPGAGKTYIMLHMAYCVAIGADRCFVWDVPAKRPVCYVDAEMDSGTLQERLLEIAKGWDMVLPESGFFKLITPDIQPKDPPRINTKDGRARIEEHASEGGLLVLDNLFTLCPGADEKESEDWAVIQEWILHLRRRRIAVFIVQHSNRSGDQQYGTSKREVQLACNLMLRTASDYSPEEGLCVQATLKKLRRRGKAGRFVPSWAAPFEIALRVEDGAANFSTRPIRDLLKKRAVEMLIAGMRENDVAQETGLDRFTIYRLKRRIREDGAAAATAD